MSQETPNFGSEYAKSDRSMCKLCKSCIGMGSLRLSIYVQSPFFDGKVNHYTHQKLKLIELQKFLIFFPSFTKVPNWY